MVNIIDQKCGFRWCSAIKNIDEILKIRDLINNLKAYQKYQNAFVIFDAESKFEYMCPVLTLLSFFSFVKK